MYQITSLPSVSSNSYSNCTVFTIHHVFCVPYLIIFLRSLRHKLCGERSASGCAPFPGGVRGNALLAQCNAMGRSDGKGGRPRG